jgi:hypothetical protein
MHGRRLCVKAEGIYRVFSALCMLALQGSSSTARLGGKAKYAGIVGMGPRAKAVERPEWGTSPFQVPPSYMLSLLAWLPASSPLV